ADATIVSTNDVLVHTNRSTDLNFDDEPTTRFSCPSNLGNHAPSPGTFSSSLYDDEFGAAINNVASTVEVSPVETKRINTIHPQSLIIEDPTSAALEDPSWVDAMQEEMQQFKFQNVWILVDLPAELMRKYMSLNLKVLWILNIPRRSTRRGTIDKTLFHKKNNTYIILVQVYVDEIIFGSTKKAWCDEFEALMKGEFQMSTMGELTFFL
nr:ribonuclease H-like domain, reverse transcriptase, RNA-dependent DNA polymerase [Tanacetum cinerariifolium]